MLNQIPFHVLEISIHTLSSQYYRGEAMSGKTNPGDYFEDFQIGKELVHATPRTVAEGDVSLYSALYGSRCSLQMFLPVAWD